MSLLQEFAKQLDITIYCDDQYDFEYEMSIDEDEVWEITKWYFAGKLICTSKQLTNWSNSEDYEFTELGVRILGAQLGNIISQRINEKIIFKLITLTMLEKI